MNRTIITISATVAILFFAATAFTEECPTGIASIKLGDSKRTVYDKIVKSKHIECKSKDYQSWLTNLDGRRREDEIKLFDRQFCTIWTFSKKDKLYKIDLETFSTIIVPGFEHCSKKEVKLLNTFIVNQYSKKYGKPRFLDLNAYPSCNDLSRCFCDVARWRFPNDISVKMHVSKRTKYIDFHITIIDNVEEKRILKDEKKKQELERKKEEEQWEKEVKKSQELL